jgi:hypothetical protein
MYSLVSPGHSMVTTTVRWHTFLPQETCVCVPTKQAPSHPQPQETADRLRVIKGLAIALPLLEYLKNGIMVYVIFSVMF